MALSARKQVNTVSMTIVIQSFWAHRLEAGTNRLELY